MRPKETEETKDQYFHALKTHKKYWREIAEGRKTFELRKNDRDFRVGDALTLYEFDEDEDRFTGWVIDQVDIVGILTPEEFPGLRHGNVILSIVPLRDRTRDISTCQYMPSAAQERYQHTNEAYTYRELPASPVLTKEETLLSTVTSLYFPPFTYNQGYIFDSEGNIFADKQAEDTINLDNAIDLDEDKSEKEDGETSEQSPSATCNGLLRIRGWGRLGKRPDGAKLQDRVGKYVAALLTEHWGENSLSGAPTSRVQGGEII
jgi:hypothetical protein